ncbi:SARP family transcriptional regulator [Nonomuraea mesophila]|uniref:SARP family transcriptional regulator n=1 Tax=Nonomuraea mesophila TaxID=2530382 RepID=A0A4R5FW06_9ACTN|nr:BTAD domain-containing putative transcriptional regulator [Nonomuraea mesophila]TDE58902.1 SARP family transcriptional regulator [Nonomuraea mesophila]
MADSGRRVFIMLLGGFRLMAADEQIVLSSGSERLLAYLALNRTTVTRAVMAAQMWPGAAERRAQASLRSALARLDGGGRALLRVDSSGLGLCPEVGVDVEEARALALRLLDPLEPPGDDDVCTGSIRRLSDGLLPGWYDEWVLAASDEWHQLRLHALEALSGLFLKAGRFAEAVSAASVAVRAEPLRESACAALVDAHLAEGNQAEALRHFQVFERNLSDELGITPTPRLHERVAGLLPRRPSLVRTPSRRGHARMTER